MRVRKKYVRAKKPLPPKRCRRCRAEMPRAHRPYHCGRCLTIPQCDVCCKEVLDKPGNRRKKGRKCAACEKGLDAFRAAMVAMGQHTAMPTPESARRADYYAGRAAAGLPLFDAEDRP